MGKKKTDYLRAQLELNYVIHLLHLLQTEWDWIKFAGAYSRELKDVMCLSVEEELTDSEWVTHAGWVTPTLTESEGGRADYKEE